MYLHCSSFPAVHLFYIRGNNVRNINILNTIYIMVKTHIIYYVNSCYMKQHISHDTTANIQIFPHNLLTNLTTKLTAGIHPAAHSLVVETNRHAPLILLLLLLLLPIMLPIPKSFDSTAFNRKQLIMDIDSIEYNCKQVILLILLCLCRCCV